MAIVAKTCTKCGEMKPLGEYWRDSERPDGRHTQCRECRAKVARRSREAHPDTEPRYRKAHSKAAAAKVRRYYRRVRAQVQTRYGPNGVAACCCCGTTENLSIDHIHGGGHAHRMELFGRETGYMFYVWLIREGFPPGYQTLCVPCNSSKGEGESCSLYHPLKYLAENGFYLR